MIYPRYIQDIPKIYPRYTQDIPEIYLRYTRDIPEIYQKYTRDIPRIYPRYTQDLPKIYPRYTRDIPEIYPRYTRDIPEIYLRYTRYIPEIYPRYTQDIPKRVSGLSQGRRLSEREPEHFSVGQRESVSAWLRELPTGHIELLVGAYNFWLLAPAHTGRINSFDIGQIFVFSVRRFFCFRPHTCWRSSFDLRTQIGVRITFGFRPHTAPVG